MFNINSNLIKNDLCESKEDQEKFLNWAGEELANKFYKIKDRLRGQEKDIYYWMRQDPQNLENKINSLAATKTKKEENDLAKQGAILIYEDASWSVYSILSFEASKKYGAHTKWCITGKESGWNDKDQENEYWNIHMQQGMQFYFYINKQNPDEKYAATLVPGNPEQVVYFDVLDNQIDEIPGAPDLLTILDKQPMLIKDHILIRIKESDNYIIPDNVWGIRYGALPNLYKIKTISLPKYFGALPKQEALKNNIIPLAILAMYSFITIRDDDPANPADKLSHQRFTGSTKTILYDHDLKMLLCNRINNKIPAGTAYIFSGAFNNANITSLQIPASVNYIYEFAFTGLSNLKTLKFDSNSNWNFNNIKEISQGPEHILINCPNLKEIYLPDKLEITRSYDITNTFDTGTATTIYSKNVASNVPATFSGQSSGTKFTLINTNKAEIAEDFNWLDLDWPDIKL